ncbi:Hypothetical predicted protein [Octopus vulgaris]|uniref:Uncharacterized protein n=1 Tax=Octopus vulgaris TaxID=6645 RepID=A0AA36BHW3_OCTVU|nr:Hypothetical predicted protein [Octopus vulgaris]
MSKRKLDGERDTEEILNIIESGDDTEYFIEEIGNADELRLILHPPNYSDEDDASSDCKESSVNLRDIGRDGIRAYSKPGVEVLDVDTEVILRSAKKHCSRAKKSSHKRNNKPLKQSPAKYYYDSGVTELSIVIKFRDKFEPTDIFKERFSKDNRNRICSTKGRFAVYFVC